ncbi:flagella cluster protein [halophilic archaeon]|nr:flagella cluster protein [halophilic archaeon]
MTALDVHEVRHRLKLKKDAGHTKLFENRDGVACPACGEPFDDLLATDRREYSLDPPGSARLCVVREDDRLLLLPHR